MMIVKAMRIPPAEKVTVDDFLPMLDTIKARSDLVAKLRSSLASDRQISKRLY